MLGSDSMIETTLIKKIKDPFRQIDDFNPGEVKVYLELIKAKKEKMIIVILQKISLIN